MGEEPVTIETPIDAAYAALEAAKDDAGLRIAFYGQLMASELFLVLEAELEGERLRPLVLGTEAGEIVLAFDRVERLAAFLDVPRDYVALSGRSLVAMLEGQRIGIALNSEVAPSASVIGAETVDWLAGLATRTDSKAERVTRFQPPARVPTRLITALQARLGAYAGRVREGFLALAEYDGGGEGLVLALAGVPSEAECAVAEAISEAVRFSGVEGVLLDVMFPDDVALGRVARVGIALRPVASAWTEARAPGRETERPPRLR